MKRRELLLASGALGALAAAPFPTFAQQPGRLRRVAVLGASTRAHEDPILQPFYDGMRERGWEEGRNIAYDRAHADDDHARLPALAAGLVKRNPARRESAAPRTTWTASCAARNRATCRSSRSRGWNSW